MNMKYKNKYVQILKCKKIIVNFFFFQEITKSFL